MKIRLPALEKRRRGLVAEVADLEEENADVEVVAYVEEEADMEETDEEQETDEEEEEQSAIAADPDWLPPLDEDSPSQEQ